ncbi:MAG: cobyric acid synthase, partial [Chloroflexi bacterium]|nr:cobyric acid synthase [Chloroflexota bacterium]
RLPAGEYMSRRGELWEIVTHALDSLRAEYDLVVVEGAGSPVELNLRRGDLVNMAIAEYADAPVALVGDVDRGGIFAQLLGTLDLLEGTERARLRAFIVNKFRGDARLFEDGVRLLQERSGVPVLGVVPFIYDLRIADEDSVALEELMAAERTGDPAAQSPNTSDPGARPLDVVVIRFPHISNFDDFDPLRAEQDVAVRFVDRAEDIGKPDLVILPGTKTTIADLAFARERGLASRIVDLARSGVPTLGICGGYQMLGRAILDPDRVESDEDRVEGLGLLPIVTTFQAEKQTVRARGCLAAGDGLFAGAHGLEITGYEIHMGRTEAQAGAPALIRVSRRGERAEEDEDGAVSEDGRIAGTYFHGLFDNDALRAALLNNLAARRGTARATHPLRFDRGVTYDRLAQIVREHLDMSILYRLVGL